MPIKSMVFLNGTKNETSKKSCSRVPKYGYGYDEYVKRPYFQVPRPKYRNIVGNDGVTKRCYYNLMWDPHVFRSSTFKTFQLLEEERAKLLNATRRKIDLSKRSQVARESIIRFEIEIPKTPRKENKREHVLNLDQFIVESPPSTQFCEVGEQTDDFKNYEKIPDEVEAKIGFDVSTQMEIEDMFDMEKERAEIAEIIAHKVLEQSVFEELEEEELRILKEEENKYEEKRREEGVRLRRLENRLRILWRQNEDLMKELRKLRAEEDEANEIVGAKQFAISYLKLLSNETVFELEKDGFTQTSQKSNISVLLEPWINNCVEEEVGMRNLSLALIEDMLRTIVEDRERDPENYLEKLMFGDEYRGEE